MTEEEKKAIAYLRFYLGDNENEYFDKDFVVNKKDLQIILNLIQKQDTEINKLNKKISRAIAHIEACKTTLGNYILSPNETECLLNILDEERRGEYE